MESQPGSWAWVDCPQLFLLFAFMAHFSLLSQLIWVVPECFLGWGGRGTCKNAREKQMSLQSKKWWGGLGEVGEYKALEKPLSFWNS